MLAFFSVLHVLLCVFMIFVILLQPGKDAGMGAALGGGASTTVFGGRGAVTFLGKVTAVCAIGYFLTSLGLSFVGLKRSVTDGVVPPAPPPVVALADAGVADVAGASPADAKPVDTAPPPPPVPDGTESVPADKK
jgi:preprotein translocase subunit SecG